MKFFQVKDLYCSAPPPVAPPMPNQWKTATEHDRDSLEVPDRPASASSRNEQVHIDNLRDVISSIHQHIPDKTTLSIPRGPILDSKLNSRPSTGSHRRIDSDLDDDDDDDEDDLPPTPIQQSAVYATILPPPLQQPAQHSRQNSYAESIRTITSTSTSRHSPAPSMTKNNAQRTSITSAQQQQGERTSQRAPSVNLSNRRSSDRFPSPPPSHVESLDLTGGGGSIHKPRSTSTLSSRSSAYVDANEVNPPVSFHFTSNPFSYSRPTFYPLNVSILTLTFQRQFVQITLHVHILKLVVVLQLLLIDQARNLPNVRHVR